MRRLTGYIMATQFSPMVVIPSWMDITVDVPALGVSIPIRTQGTIEQLSNIFGFIIVNEHHWDLTPMRNRECEITEHQNGTYTFSRYL
jgi:hypothetical protein